MLALAAAATSLTACGNHYPAHTTPGTYAVPILVTGTSAGSALPTTHVFQLPLIVTPD